MSAALPTPRSLAAQGQSPRHLVRLQEAPAQPWRNGGGVTRELLAWPAPQTQRAHSARSVDNAGWAVRVSVADITQDGPFSAFPGIDRCFTVLEGAGVVLTLHGSDLRLRPDSDPLAFDGADAPGCRLVNGATRDLNLMVRQSAGRAWMQRAVPGQAWDSAAQRLEEPGLRAQVPQGTGSREAGQRWAWRGLYTHGPAGLDTPDGRQVLPAGSLLWSDAGECPAWRLIEGAQAWWLGLLTAHPAEEDA